MAVPSWLGNLGKCWMSAPSDTIALIEINRFVLHFGFLDVVLVLLMCFVWA